MRGARGDARQQPGPPLGEHVAPGALGRLALEVRRPVGDAARVAQRLVPVPRGHRGAGVRHLLQLRAVTVQPAVHGRGLAVPHEGLHGHRRVIAEPAVALRSRDMDALQRLVEGACGVVHADHARHARAGADRAAVPVGLGPGTQVHRASVTGRIGRRSYVPGPGARGPSARRGADAPGNPVRRGAGHPEQPERRPIRLQGREHGPPGAGRPGDGEVGAYVSAVSCTRRFRVSGRRAAEGPDRPRQRL